MRWVMMVYCRRDGVSRDGGRHASWDHEPSAQEVENELRFLRMHYDEVHHTIEKETPARETGRPG